MLVRLTINGRECILPHGLYTYEDIASMAGQTEPSITWSHRAENWYGGNVFPGESLIIEDGMHICAVNTGSA